MSDSELNGNVPEGDTIIYPKSDSMEDLSEYTDADQSISAPTEILAEFLSSIMMKDYEKAQKYCALILYYEPNNLTAKEFYPLIKEKLEIMKNQEYEDSYSEHSDDCNSTSSSSSLENDSDGTTASYSSLEDDEVDVDNNDITNGNTNHIGTGISSTLNQENKPIGSEEIKGNTIVQNKTSPSKLVHSASPTIHKGGGSVELTGTRINTKRFHAYSESKTPANSPQSSIKNCNISGIKNSKNSQKKVITDKVKTTDVLYK